MTITDIFDFKDELDSVLSKIGEKSELFFKFYIEFKADNYSDDIWNEGYVENDYQLGSMISDVVDTDWAREIYAKLDDTDLVFPGDAMSLQLLYEDEYVIVSYAIELHMDSRA